MLNDIKNAPHFDDEYFKGVNESLISLCEKLTEILINEALMFGISIPLILEKGRLCSCYYRGIIVYKQQQAESFRFKNFQLDKLNIQTL